MNVMFGRGRRRDRTTAPAPVTPVTPEVAEQVAGMARDAIASGFRDQLDVVTDLADHWGESDTPVDATTVSRIVEAEWQRRLAAQQTWPDQGDYARLAAAFDELEVTGVTARMNFACCQNCGHLEIADERRPEQDGYTFFHEQDADRVTDGRLYLAFGSFTEVHAQSREDYAATEAAVGRRVVEAVRRQGLRVDWDGTNGARPVVAITSWHKYLPTD